MNIKITDGNKKQIFFGENNHTILEMYYCLNKQQQKVSNEK